MRIKTMMVVGVVGCTVALGAAGMAQRAAAPAGPAADADPVIKELGKLVGGRWVCRLGPNKDFVIEGSAEWTAHGRGIRWSGVIGKGRPDSTQMTSLMGVDKANKSVYYLDCHSHDTVYKGTVRKEGDKLVYEFDTIVGTPNKWKSEQSFPDKDTYLSTIYAWKDGKWEKLGNDGLTYKRELEGGAK